MTDIEKAESVLVDIYPDGVPADLALEYAQTYATLSIARSLDFICGRMSSNYAEGNPVADAIYQLANVVNHRG